MQFAVEVAEKLLAQSTEIREEDDVGCSREEQPVHNAVRLNTAWTAASGLVYAGCQWATIIVLSRTGGAELLGQFALAVMIITPVSELSKMQLRIVQATDARRLHEFSDYYVLRCLTSIGFLFTTLVIARILSANREWILIVLILALGKSVDAMADVYYGFFQQRECMKPIAIALVLNGLGSVVLLFIGLGAAHNVLLGFLGYGLGSVLALLWIVREAARIGFEEGEAGVHLWRTRNWRRTAVLARTSWPLGVVVVLASMATTIPRYVIEHEMGLKDLGLFSAAAYVTTVGTIVVSALGQAVSPSLSRDYARGQIKDFQRRTLQLMTMGGLMGIVGAALAWRWGSEILGALYSGDFARGREVLILLSIASGIGFAAAFAGYGMTAAQRFGIQLPLFSIVCGASAVASVGLVPRFGLLGAASAVAIAYGVQLVLSLAVIKRYILGGAPAGGAAQRIPDKLL